jgi:hypothetical protein
MGLITERASSERADRKEPVVGSQDLLMAQLSSCSYDRDVAQGSTVGAGRSTALVLFTDLVGSTEPPFAAGRGGC